MASLVIFNPEHDFALAVGSGPYTPPGSVIHLRKKLALLSALWADGSDFILLPPDLSLRDLPGLPYHDVFLSKGLRPIYLPDIAGISSEIEAVEPWGWDFALCRSLAEAGLDSSLLPSEETLYHIRRLSHRNFTFLFRREIDCFLNREGMMTGEEAFTTDDVEDFLLRHPAAFLKAPWSSSGRGIVASDHISRKGLMEWSSGILRRQGSVICEPRWDKVIDFASEWKVTDGEAHFLGWSVFETSLRGKYHGNMNLPQPEIISFIEGKTSESLSDILQAQKIALGKHVAPFYSGLLGIDMLADTRGRIHPCIEINLRRTMGHIYLIF